MTPRGHIPAARLLPLLQPYLTTCSRRDGGDSDGIGHLAELSGCSYRHLNDLLAGRTVTVTFGMADRLLAVVDRPDAWFNELADLYVGATA